MDRTVVLITGCSSGIGLHLALRLASDPSQSFKVYATMRDLKAQGPLWEAAQARRCPSGSLEILQLDVRDSDSVAAARARVTEGRVDVLVCNAGRGLVGPLEAHVTGAMSSVLDVNVAGTVRTLQAFLPDMKQRRSGRVLVTGSMGGLMGEWPRAGPGARKRQSLRQGSSTCSQLCRRSMWRKQKRAKPRETSGVLLQPSRVSAPGHASTTSSRLQGLPFNAVYCASKFALEGLCESLAVLLPSFGVHVSLIECGPVHTAFQEKLEGGLGGALDSADTKTRDHFFCYQRHCERVFREAAQDPEEVTEVFLKALRAPQPALRYFSTEHFLPLVRLRFDDPSGCSYVAAMRRAVFEDKSAERPDGAPAKPGAADLGGCKLSAPAAAQQ
ncbi:17-beta-hydroxysteroid dehydrogenase type 1 isoform X1 [Elephas maximus indicus]|uniref:17-beta-hydroxysteroid dehydrogenase type 1 isoform X1 n=1 Tax=Elephas maximus indicus TaxID=99487 RepID=UPI002116681A|nr:17-beta-hydroxysteroid dehydrogenase type 1 isoform X1 [Elephas maximus indicus]